MARSRRQLPRIECIEADVANQRGRDAFGLRVVASVENKSGAGGVLAAQAVARSAAEGHTLMVAAVPQTAILPWISRVPYNAERDFAPVSQLVGTDLLLVTNPRRVPSASMAEFVSWAKKQSTLFFGTPGPGTVGHFGAHLVAEALNVKVEPIHYRTTGEQMTGVLNGDIHAQFFSYAAACQWSIRAN